MVAGAWTFFLVDDMAAPDQHFSPCPTKELLLLYYPSTPPTSLR
jgi:hypothetical protein